MHVEQSGSNGKGCAMGINVVVDEALLDQAEKLTGEHDRAKLVESALYELIKRRSPIQGMLDLAGSDILRDDYDYKALREGRGK